MSPMIETERLVLRRPGERDGDAYAQVFTSGRGKYMGPVEVTLREAWKNFYTELGHWEIRGYGMFSVTRKGDDTALGLVGPWYPHTWPAREIGWTLFEGHEGKGYATEAAIATRAWAYLELGWTGAVSYIDPENTASARVAERCGARLDPAAEGPDPGDLVYRHPSPEELS